MTQTWGPAVTASLACCEGYGLIWRRHQGSTECAFDAVCPSCVYRTSLAATLKIFLSERKIEPTTEAICIMPSKVSSAMDHCIATLRWLLHICL